MPAPKNVSIGNFLEAQASENEPKGNSAGAPRDESEYDSKMMEDLKAQIRMLRAHNAELTDNVDEYRSGMVSYEHLREVMGKLSILLIRTDRGVYKKKYRNGGKDVQKSIQMTSHKGRDSSQNRLFVNDAPSDALSDANAAYNDNNAGGFTSPVPAHRNQTIRQSVGSDQKSVLNDDRYNDKPSN